MCRGMGRMATPSLVALSRQHSPLAFRLVQGLPPTRQPTDSPYAQDTLRFFHGEGH